MGDRRMDCMASRKVARQKQGFRKYGPLVLATLSRDDLTFCR